MYLQLSSQERGNIFKELAQETHNKYKSLPITSTGTGHLKIKRHIVQTRKQAVGVQALKTPPSAKVPQCVCHSRLPGSRGTGSEVKATGRNREWKGRSTNFPAEKPANTTRSQSCRGRHHERPVEVTPPPPRVMW